METPETVKQEIELIKQNSLVKCDVYFKKHRLSRDGAAFLIATRNRALILAYAAYYSFDSFNELDLVKLRDEELMCGYIQLHGFLWGDAEEELVNSDMIEAIRLLISAYVLSERGEVALLKKKNTELIAMYESKWGFRSREAKNRLIKM